MKLVLFLAVIASVQISTSYEKLAMGGADVPTIHELESLMTTTLPSDKDLTLAASKEGETAKERRGRKKNQIDPMKDDSPRNLANAADDKLPSASARKLAPAADVVPETPQKSPDAVGGSINPLYKDQLIKAWETFEDEAKEELTQNLKTVQSQQKVPQKRLQDFIKGTYANPQQDVVLASHMSIGKDQLSRLDTLQRFWQGPLSLAVRVVTRSSIDAFFDYYSQLPTSITGTWTVHFILEYIQPFEKDSFAAQYCHNPLRNLALHSPVIPDFVLPVDLDFVPTYGAYPILMNMMDHNPYLWDKMRSRKLLVLPVMEVVHIPDSLHMDATSLATALQDIEANRALKQDKANQKLLKEITGLKIYKSGEESDLPKSREELSILFRYNVARPWHNEKGHAPSNLPEYWSPVGHRHNLTATTYLVEPTTKYEPYFIGYKPDLPKYWEAFRGFGLNKQSFVRECLLSGFGMEALYDLYLTHLAHKSRMNRTVKQINKKEWDQQFQPYLESKYPKPASLQGNRWYTDPTKT